MSEPEGEVLHEWPGIGRHRVARYGLRNVHEWRINAAVEWEEVKRPSQSLIDETCRLAATVKALREENTRLRQERVEIRARINGAAVPGSRHSALLYAILDLLASPSVPAEEEP